MSAPSFSFIPPVYFFLFFTDHFYEYKWTLEKQETLIWLQHLLPLQTTSSQSQLLFIRFIHCFLFRSLPPLTTIFGTQSPFLSDFIIWLINLLKSSLMFCAAVLHYLQLFWCPSLCPISLLSHHHTVWHPLRMNSRPVSHLFLPIHGFQCCLLLFSPSQFTLPLGCSHKCPVHLQVLRSLPRQPPPLLGNILGKSWSLLNWVQSQANLLTSP